MRIHHVIRLFLVVLLCGGSLRAADILRDADARIRRYRTGELVLRVTDPSGRPLPKGAKVQIEQTRHSFLFGSNIFALGKCKTAEDNAAYENAFADLLNYATFPFYWWTYEPVEGQPDYAGTERIVQWCRQHNIQTKGHPLAWNYFDPSWLPHDPEQAMRAQMDRVGKCATKFRDEVNFWDVVNEATEFDREETQKNSPVLTEAIRRMGVSDYVRSAFRAVREANPRAVLLINDYRTEADYAEKVISKLTDDAGNPLYNVIGIQSHQHSGAWSVEKIWEVCERFAAFGKPLHFTETTFLSGKLGWELKEQNPDFKWESTPEGERRQAEEVVRFYTILFSHPAVEAITWWDLTDQGAWQGAPCGLLREDMTPKPAYGALKGLIKGKWWTRTEAVVGEGGEAKFCGFFGEYRVAAGEEGRERAATFFFDKTTRGPVTVKLE